MLFSNAAEDHRSHAAVPDRERFHPLCCRLAVPEYVLLSGVPLRGRGGERGWHSRKEFSSVERHAAFSVWRKFTTFGRTLPRLARQARYASCPVWLLVFA